MEGAPLERLRSLCYAESVLGPTWLSFFRTLAGLFSVTISVFANGSAVCGMVDEKSTKLYFQPVQFLFWWLGCW